MKDIVLGAIRENTRELLKLANGKIKGKKIQIGLFHDSNADDKEYSYFVVVNRIWWRFSIISDSTTKPFKNNEKDEADKYFSSLVEKHNLKEVFYKSSFFI